jgi:hypothetical protein
MLLEQPVEMAAADAQAFRQRIEPLAIERAVADQPHRAMDGRPRTLPGWRKGRGFRPAAQARSETCRFGGRRRGIEGDMAALGAVMAAITLHAGTLIR